MIGGFGHCEDQGASLPPVEHTIPLPAEQFDLPAVVELNGLAFDANDNLYVADTGNSRIATFSPAGQVLANWK